EAPGPLPSFAPHGLPDSAMLAHARARLDRGKANGAELFFAAAGSGDPARRMDAETAFRPVALFLAKATASPVQYVFEHRPFSPEDWTVLREWWHAWIDDRL